MNIIVILFPLALGLGLAGLAGFFWCMRTGQYNDLEGSGWRVLQDDDLADDQSPHANATRQPERAL
ncbi:cytochrome oxidase maturation protein, cbb3-type [Bosea sp. OK403]|uniref:cbb3-type cytochrome oxidase assembly protein CcoS n=1 Tax=Bosea sp. OK403 TaxID=1855286 RepID=UPI0008DF5663|nr:cbb3-type cytochrome oxidase assembly protein CcoS [Bosea sp. OK403]SFI13347.1 cytochrome oxidase maturation protein, cbb3-type [Bosea sp. OK403]